MQLETLHTRGDALQLGHAHGEALRDRIQQFIAMRFDAVRQYLQERGMPDSTPLVETARASARIHQTWDSVGYTEHEGIAAGANVDAIDLFLATNMTDMRDALLLSAPRGPRLKPVEEQGCTSVLVPGTHTRGGQPIAAQTWDLNPPDIEYVVAIHRVPTDGPATWSVTCAGCLSLTGINELGLAVGTTNVKTYGSRPGVGYLGVLHRMLTSRTFGEVQTVVESAPLAAAHTYWVADANQQIEWEASPERRVARDTRQGPIWRSNHCLVPEHIEIEGEVPKESTYCRYQRMGALISEQPPDVERMKVIFSDRSDGVNSINRYPEDNQGTATNSVFIAEPAQRRATACRGPADRGEFIELTF